MDEYFCPNCGATLNYQMGFEPSRGSWTCTVCGQHLMDEDVGNGTRFPDVAWYCDNCNALLNKQAGFSDLYTSWICTECGHVSPITEDDIINDDTARLVCPSCGDSLEEQWLFDESEEDWICTTCGAHLHREFYDDHYDVVYDDYADEHSGSEGLMYYNSSPRREAASNYKDMGPSENDLKKIRRKALFFSRKKIEIGYYHSELLGVDCNQVRSMLHKKAFNNIRIIPVEDIYKDSAYKENEVAQVSVGGCSTFNAFDKFSYDTEIIIMYHKKKEIVMPFSARSLHKKNYIEVCNQLRALGFIEVYGGAIKDLTTGWLKQDGSVERVSIAGNSSFKKKDVFKYDDRINVDYHAYRNK